MVNCAIEFLEHTEGKQILCAYIGYGLSHYIEDEKKVYLKIGYTKNDFQKFIEEISFEYDDGYGSQNVDGVIWYVDGTWSDRHEYDGAEWWVYRAVPEIPQELKE